MKNIFKLIGIIALVALIGFSFVTCGGGDSGEETPPISAFAGIWNASNGRSIYIIGDWFEYKVITDKTYDGNFSVSGSNITFNATGKGAESGKYTLSGDTLTLSNHTWDNTVNGTYTKVGDGGDNVLATMTFTDTGNWNQDETYPRWKSDYQDADKSFDLAGMRANNKAYFITYSFSSDIDIDELAFEFYESYSDGTYHWVNTTDWTRITLDIIKKNTKYNGSIFALPNAAAVGTQAARTYFRLYVKNRNITTGANMTFYQLKFEQVEIVDLNINVTADGSASSTTTQLTLTLAKAIPGLSADNITLSGVDGVSKGTLSNSGTTYTLPISGFTKTGTLNVGVEKSGYVFKNWLKTTTIYYYKASTGGGGDGGTFSSLDDFKNWLNGKGNNSKNNPYNVKLNLSNLSGLLDFLKSLSGKFVKLDFSGSGLTSIGADAFKGLSNLTGLTLPSGITGGIGANAFDGCSNLTDITLPSGITGIGDNAFNGCTSLTGITIPSGVTSIGASAFNGCTNLNSVTFNGTITSGNFSSTTPFPGDLRDKYLAGGSGTYTRTSGSTTWTKEGGGGGTDIASFAGTWNASGNRSIVFSGSSFTYKVNGTTTYSGTFSVSGSTITFNATGLGTASGGYSLSGTTLTLLNHTWDSSVNGTYTKDGGSSGGDTAVTFSGVTANGSSTQTTTQLTLTFSQAITGLSADDITLSGVTVTKGTLTNSGSTYTLPISGFTAGGTLNVAVAKSGYSISGSPKTVTIYVFEWPIVTNTSQWNLVLTAIRNGGNGTSGSPKTYVIEVSGNVSVPGSTANATSFGTVSYIEVTLKGSGTLTLSSNGSILYISGNQKLVINDENITLKGRDGNTYSVLTVASTSGTTLNLIKGTISGNTNSSNTFGGGVIVYENATFNMSGGTISGNTAKNGGGGVGVAGTFNMSGGTISGNSCLYDSGSVLGATNGNGGGVSISQNGTFKMTGGIISGNNAGNGGGVWLQSYYGAKFTKSGGGIIYGNDAGDNSNKYKGYGAAVYDTSSSSRSRYINSSIGEDKDSKDFTWSYTN